MPSYLHPRSRSTSTLFTTTLAVSFLVVALPHVLPCPADRRSLADSATRLDKDGQPMKRRKAAKTQVNSADGLGIREVGKTLAGDQEAQDQEDGGRLHRECPVPKPTSMLQRLIGMQPTREQTMEVVIQRRSPPSDAEANSKVS